MSFNEYRTVKSCCICNSKDLDLVLDMGKTPLANNLANNCDESIIQRDYDLCLIICKNCNHVQLNTEIDKQILFGKYNYKTGISSTMLNHFNYFADKLCKYFDKKNKLYSEIKVLDIGSNDSALLDILRLKGYKTYGIESASNLANRSSHNIFNGFFEDKNINLISKKFGAFDVITANNVFAHNRDLNKFIKNMSYLLKEDGMISIEVQYLPKLIEKCYVDMIYHEHTSYHHFKPLNKFFKKYNLILNSVTNIPTHGGSMRIILNNSSENIISFENKDKSQNFIKADNKFDRKILNNLWLLKSKIENIKSSLNSSIRSLTKKYPLLYGYSAPAKIVTLLSLLENDIINDIQFVIEDNDLKQGKYIPKTKIPIISAKEAIDEIDTKKSACIIFAWNMFDELSKKIISKPKLNPDILISPLPEPKVLEINYDQYK